MDTGSLITDDRMSSCHFVSTFYFFVDCKQHNSTSLTVQSMQHNVVYLTVNSTHDAVCLKVNSARCVSWRPLRFWSSFQLFCLVSISFFLITASLHFLPVELPLLFPFAALFLAAHSFITLMCCTDLHIYNVQKSSGRVHLLSDSSLQAVNIQKQRFNQCVSPCLLRPLQPREQDHYCHYIQITVWIITHLPGERKIYLCIDTAGNTTWISELKE